MTDRASLRPAQLGPYVVLAQLGRGGTGTVYRARDTRFGREVAIKVVHLGDDPRGHRRERLLAETRAAGRLNHPHVMAVLDVGIDGGRPYMVSELIDGDSLRTLLDRGPVPRQRVLDLATQIASGLAAAHAADLVHRDLKPENIMVTRQGVAKIVDFGLAKSLTSPPGAPAPVDTLTAPHTVLGTVHYMSPEQARGATLDTRSDQFAFGAVLYEMLSGRRAFARDNTIETLAAILREDPPALDALDPPVPPPLQWVLDRCLAKLPDDRYSSTADLWHDLRALPARLEAAATAVVLPTPPALTPARRATLAAVAVALLGAGWLAATRTATPVALAPPTWQRLTFEQGFVDAARFSGDGQTVFYSAAWNNTAFRTFSTTVTSPESRALDIPPAGLLAVSASGELALARDCRFVAATGRCAGILARAPSLGGAPRDLATDIHAADWASDGALAVARGQSDGFTTIEFPIGTVLSRRGNGHVRVSRDGRQVAWTESTASTMNGIVVQGPAGRRTLAAGWRFISGLAWNAAGDALFVSGVSAMSGDDAVVRLALDGTMRAVLRGTPRVRVLDVDQRGRLLVSVGTTSTRLQLWEAAQARPRDLTWLGNSHVDAVSPDGRRVLFTMRGGIAVETTSVDDLYPVFVRDTAGGAATRVGVGYGVALSSDHAWAVTRTRPVAGPASLVLVPLGAGDSRALPRGDIDVGVGNSLVDFAGPGHIALRARESAGPWRTYRQALDGGLPQVVEHEPGVIVSPVAPDGERFVAQRDDGSRWISRLSTAEPGPMRLVMDAGARVLQWTEDGRALITLRNAGRGAEVNKVDIASGRVTKLRDVAASGEAGVTDLRGLTAMRGGALVAGSEVRVSGALYLVDGAR